MRLCTVSRFLPIYAFEQFVFAYVFVQFVFAFAYVFVSSPCPRQWVCLSTKACLSLKMLPVSPEKMSILMKRLAILVWVCLNVSAQQQQPVSR